MQAAPKYHVYAFNEFQVTQKKSFVIAETDLLNHHDYQNQYHNNYFLYRVIIVLIIQFT